MSELTQANPPATQRSPSPPTRVEDLFETIVFASRWIQAPLYGGLIVAGLLYAYKSLVELWEMVVHIRQLHETAFMLRVMDKLHLHDLPRVCNSPGLDR